MRHVAKPTDAGAPRMSDRAWARDAIADQTRIWSALVVPVAILYAATTGKLDDVPTPRVKDFETGFYRFLEAERPKVLGELGSGKAWTDEIAAALTEAIDEFRKSFLA